MEKFKNLSKRMFEPEEDELEMQECTACGFSEDVESPDEMEECPECGEELINYTRHEELPCDRCGGLIGMWETKWTAVDKEAKQVVEICDWCYDSYSEWRHKED